MAASISPKDSTVTIKPLTLHPEESFDVTERKTASLATQILFTKVFDARLKKEISVKVVNPKPYTTRFPVYDLVRVKGKGGVLGQIWLSVEHKESIPGGGQHIWISFMESSHKKFKDGHHNIKRRYLNVGKALHEFAVRRSFEEGLMGRVYLQADLGADGFHYKCGFRYVNRKGGDRHKKNQWLQEQLDTSNTKMVRRGGLMCLSETARSEWRTRLGLS